MGHAFAYRQEDVWQLGSTTSSSVARTLALPAGQ